MEANAEAGITAEVVTANATLGGDLRLLNNSASTGNSTQVHDPTAEELTHAIIVFYLVLVSLLGHR